MAHVHVWIIGNFSEANDRRLLHRTVEDRVVIVKIIRKSDGDASIMLNKIYQKENCVADF